MAQCHALILQNNNDTGRRTIPGKAFEYLATGRPLVVGALNSDLEALVGEWGDMAAWKTSKALVQIRKPSMDAAATCRRPYRRTHSAERRLPPSGSGLRLSDV